MKKIRSILIILGIVLIFFSVVSPLNIFVGMIIGLFVICLGILLGKINYKP